MRFTLTYTGELKANGNLKHKHDLRQKFHSQLKVLWQHEPLVKHQYWFNPGGGKHAKTNLNRKIGTFRFVPLVSPSLYLICELRIFLLKPEPPGAIVTQAGDIDNRLKTLLDALRIPKTIDELPKDVISKPDEDPFFCLLEDDALITGITVETERLLTTSQNPTDVHLDIQVVTRPTQVIVENRILGNFGLV